MAAGEEARADIIRARPYFCLLADGRLPTALRHRLIDYCPHEFHKVFFACVGHAASGRLNIDDVDDGFDRQLRFYADDERSATDKRLALHVLPAEFYERLSRALYDKCPSCK
jgi:hypothetical protein